MKNTIFSTDSFQLASFLLSESCSLLSLDKANPRRILFIFEESDKRKELTEKFLAYLAVVEPHRLYSTQRDLKQLIHEERRIYD